MTLLQLPYQEVWVYDFEFNGNAGDVPKPVCMVARELKSGRLERLWRDELHSLSRPPFSTEKQNLFVAFYAAAELNCHLALGWPLPINVLDLFTEYRVQTNGKGVAASLIAAMERYGLPAIEQTHKDKMRQLILSGGPWDERQQKQILDYCQTDVEATARLLSAMLPSIDLPRALIRGMYMGTAARMEYTGVPIDVPLLQRLQRNWDTIKEQFIREVDAKYGVFEGRTFKTDRFASWLALQNIPWPRLPSGRLAMDRDTFKDMTQVYPALADLKNLRDLLGQTRTLVLPVGTDGRNRASLSAFRTVTGRNQPGTTSFVFALPSWLRALIRPAEGRALAYIDWSQQEFGISAVLSNDPAMIDAYRSGDPYLRFGQQCGGIPPGATKKSHAAERERYKTCVLGVQYRMGAHSLAMRIGKPPAYGEELLAMHRRTYPVFWKWNQEVIDSAILGEKAWTVFGWPLHVTTKTKPNTIGNFPSQANGAEMLRLACTYISRAGIPICAPVHDAILIEAGNSEIDDVAAEAQRIMADASAAVLDGFQLRSDVRIIRYPHNFNDAAPKGVFASVLRIVERVEAGEIRPARVRRITRPVPGTRRFLSLSSRRK